MFMNTNGTVLSQTVVTSLLDETSGAFNNFQDLPPRGAAYRCKKQTALNKILDALDQFGPAMVHLETCPDPLGPSRDSLHYTVGRSNVLDRLECCRRI